MPATRQPACRSPRPTPRGEATGGQVRRSHSPHGWRPGSHGARWPCGRARAATGVVGRRPERVAPADRDRHRRGGDRQEPPCLGGCARPSSGWGDRPPWPSGRGAPGAPPRLDRGARSPARFSSASGQLQASPEDLGPDRAAPRAGPRRRRRGLGPAVRGSPLPHVRSRCLAARERFLARTGPPRRGRPPMGGRVERRASSARIGIPPQPAPLVIATQRSGVELPESAWERCRGSTVRASRSASSSRASRRRRSPSCPRASPTGPSTTRS